MGRPPKAEDAQDADDFTELHRLISSAKVGTDADLQELSRLVNDHHRRRLHQALDKVLDRIRQKRCAGDRKFLRSAGVKP